ncbi:hypothetical protein E2C01_048256 [Portunus trituberculatus]|uniref:Uncharacterized protein n=1 Tax=Portunus trituberculatus TaxID=210409 RepID=A0A5B7GA39_PORTR|nr:hypothetical protein [Portunus trituberculatus]
MVAHPKTLSYPDLQTPWVILQTAGSVKRTGRAGKGLGGCKAGRRDVGLESYICGDGFSFGKLNSASADRRAMATAAGRLPPPLVYTIAEI